MGNNQQNNNSSKQRTLNGEQRPTNNEQTTTITAAEMIHSITESIPWGFVHSLRYHANGKCKHHSFFYFGKDSANGQYYGSFAKSLPFDAAAERNVDYEMIGPIYNYCCRKSYFGQVIIQFINPECEHKLEVVLFQDNLLRITVIEGLIFPTKTHLHVHLQ